MLEADIQHREITSLYLEPMERIKSWCAMPYDGHRAGCPNCSGCHLFGPEIPVYSRMVLCWSNFDLDAHSRNMKHLHPTWTDRQCRNLLYWQKSVRSQLLEYAKRNFPGADYIQGAEGRGVNYYRTMSSIGINLDMPRNLHTVRMVLLVGWK